MNVTSTNAVIDRIHTDELIDSLNASGKEGIEEFFNLHVF